MNATIWIITAVVITGLLVVIGARYARHDGKLQSRSGKLIAIAVIAIIAAAVWVGPAIFFVADK